MKTNNTLFLFFILLISVNIISCGKKNTFQKTNPNNLSESKTKDTNRMKYCNLKARKYNLINTLINDYNIGMSGPGKSYSYQFLEFPKNFSVDSSFEKTNGKPIIIIKDYKLDTIEAMFLKFNKIYLNVNLDSAYVETDFYYHGRKNTSSEYFMKLDTANCTWSKKSYEGTVY